MRASGAGSKRQAFTAQRFGGPWSLIKTGMVGDYIRFFNRALQNKSFDRIYIDAFAGSGAFRYVPDKPLDTLFENDASQDTHAGSAKLALTVEPSFHHVHFIEEKRANVRALQRLIAESGHKHAHVEQGDANAALLKICTPTGWSSRRGVIFLDPFGMNVHWTTLKAIAATRALDVWYLFALAGAIRNLPRRFERLDHYKKEAVTRVLGTDEWVDAFYKASPSSPLPLLDPLSERPAATAMRRIASMDDLENYVGKRLRSIFAHVEPPKRLPPHFSLFFAISNPDPSAIRLARKGAGHILTKA
jgi:three-Cys-motif partner protein